MTVGQTVICIDDRPLLSSHSKFELVNPALVFGRKYTIHAINDGCCALEIDVGLDARESQFSVCPYCKNGAKTDRWWVLASRFVISSVNEEEESEPDRLKNIFLKVNVE